MIRQVRTKKIRLVYLMKRAPFIRGFKDAQKGKPFDPDAYLEGALQWDYERGRQLGVIFSGPLKIKRELNAGALVAFHEALQQKAII